MKCFFCTYATEPDYKDVDNLGKFLTPRMKLASREQTGVCAKHQRTLSKQMKYARYLALIPFTSYQNTR